MLCSFSRLPVEPFLTHRKRKHLFDIFPGGKHIYQIWSGGAGANNDGGVGATQNYTQNHTKLRCYAQWVKCMNHVLKTLFANGFFETLQKCFKTWWCNVYKRFTKQFIATVSVDVSLWLY